LRRFSLPLRRIYDQIDFHFLSRDELFDCSLAEGIECRWAAPATMY
jgi:hypothetical protein